MVKILVINRKSKNNIARIEVYEDWDYCEGEGFYDYYVCGACGEYLTNSLAVTFRKENIPKRCPKCKRKLYK